MELATTFRTDPFTILNRPASEVDHVYDLAAEHLRKRTSAREVPHG